MSVYDEYIAALTASTIVPTAKLEFLYPDETVKFAIDDVFLTDGNLTVNNQNGQRRAATVKLENSRYTYIPYQLYGQKVRLLAGLILPNGEPYVLPQGIFYINNPSQAYTTNDKTITLNLVDKWAWLDGSLNGNLDGIYQIKPNDNLFVAVEQLLLKDSGNGQPLDSTTPILDSYYLDKTSTLSDGSEIPFINAPYTLRTEAEGTYADVLLGINTMLVSSCGYTNTGHLQFKSAQTDIADYNRPVAWDFSITEKEFFGSNSTYQFTEMYNDIRVIGATVDGTQVQGRATNTNPRSSTCVQKIGYKTKTITQSKYYTAEQCNEYAKYELKRCTMIQNQISFTTSPIYHLQENQLVTLLRSDISSKPERYLVTGFTLPIGNTQSMTISAVSVDDIDIYHNWQPACTLKVLYSQVGALKFTYTDSESGTTQTVDLDNPYSVLEIPSGAIVSFIVPDDVSGNTYTISSAKLNGVNIPHDGQTCSFTMPTFDSQLVFMLTATNGADVTITYTGSYTELTDSGQAYKTIDGRKYRVFKFTTSGNLTFNSTQLLNGILGDIHCRGGGGGGSSESAGSNGYDSFISNVDLENVTITIGSGGSSTTTRGYRGDGSSFGTLVVAPGGAGAVGNTKGNGGSLQNIFGSLTDTTGGAGGAVSSSGSNGVCYLRIAI